MIRSLKQKLNFIEMIEATKTKLQFWRWRNLIIIGRIEVVKKPFLIPRLMYPAGPIFINREEIN